MRLCKIAQHRIHLGEAAEAVKLALPAAMVAIAIAGEAAIGARVSEVCAKALRVPAPAAIISMHAAPNPVSLAPKNAKGRGTLAARAITIPTVGAAPSARRALRTAGPTKASGISDRGETAAVPTMGGKANGLNATTAVPVPMKGQLAAAAPSSAPSVSTPLATWTAGIASPTSRKKGMPTALAAEART